MAAVGTCRGVRVGGHNTQSFVSTSFGVGGLSEEGRKRGKERSHDLRARPTKTSDCV